MQKKKILLINPPSNDFCGNTKTSFPSGALILIGTMCKERNHNVKIIEMSAENIDLEKLKNITMSFKPDIVGVTMSTFQTLWTKKVSNLIKQINKNILVVLGGVHPSAVGSDIFNEVLGGDISVIGEGEFAFLDIVEDKKIDEIEGICYKKGTNKARLPQMGLDYIPLPDLSLIDRNKYTGTTYWGGTNNSMYIMASRGCPFCCIFCNKSVFGYKTRFRDPEKVIEEIKWLHDRYNIAEIFLQDDTLNLNRKWIEEILNLIIKNGLNTNISYMVAFRANKELIDKKLLDLAKQANIRIIFYGVESGSPEMLKTMKKGVTVEELERAFALTHRAGIETVASFIIGLPGENEKTIRETIGLWGRLKPTYADITVANPFPNTEFETIVKRQGYLLNKNYNDYRYGGNYIRTDELSNTQLDFFSLIILFGFHNHTWIFRLPIFSVGRNRLLCKISLWFMRNIRRK